MASVRQVGRVRPAVKYESGEPRHVATALRVCLAEREDRHEL